MKAEGNVVARDGAPAENYADLLISAKEPQKDFAKLNRQLNKIKK